VASFSTHDMPTFAGFWAGADIEDRRQLGLLDEGGAVAEREARLGLLRTVRGHLGLAEDASRDETFQASVSELADGQAELAVLNAEDLWFEERPQNVPGTLHERPNWKRVAAVPLDEWDSAPATAGALARLAPRSHRRGRDGAAAPAGGGLGAAGDARS
jgi:4-alpha-glucanotransferase